MMAGGFINRDRAVKEKSGPAPVARKLYKTIKCMACGRFNRTPIYRTHLAYSEGFSKDPRKESDACDRCGARTPL